MKNIFMSCLVFFAVLLSTWWWIGRSMTSTSFLTYGPKFSGGGFEDARQPTSAESESQPLPLSMTDRESFNFVGHPQEIRSIRHMLEDSHVVTAPGAMGLDFAHFVTTGDDGRGVLACSYFDSIELTFAAEGLLINGERPLMRITAPCTPSNEGLHRISTIWVPVVQIEKDYPQPPAEFHEEYEGVLFNFIHLPTHWPESWELIELKLYSVENKNRVIEMGQPELEEILPAPLILRGF